MVVARRARAPRGEGGREERYSGLIKETFKVPTFAYQVSGEYAMLKAAIQNEWLVDDVLTESLLSFKRRNLKGFFYRFYDI